MADLDDCQERSIERMRKKRKLPIERSDLSFTCMLFSFMERKKKCSVNTQKFCMNK